MLPYAKPGMTEVPEEQAWGGKAALAITAGTPPSAIPIISNCKRANRELLVAAGTTRSPALRRSAKRVARRD